MKIGVDVDGVLRNFVGQLIATYKRHYPDHTVLPYETWKWRLDENFPDFPGDKVKFTSWLYHPKIIEEIMVRAPMFPGALHAFKELQKTRHEIIIVSHQRTGAEQYTLTWLGKHGFSPKHIHFTANKLEAATDAIIDDKKENLQAFRKAGKINICITRPWNTDEDLQPRFASFQEAVEFLKVL